MRTYRALYNQWNEETKTYLEQSMEVVAPDTQAVINYLRSVLGKDLGGIVDIEELGESE